MYLILKKLAWGIEKVDFEKLAWGIERLGFDILANCDCPIGPIGPIGTDKQTDKKTEKEFLF